MIKQKSDYEQMGRLVRVVLNEVRRYRGVECMKQCYRAGSLPLSANIVSKV